MSDIVEQLNDRMAFGMYWDVARNARDEIERLRLALSTAHAEGMEAAARIAEKFEVSYAVERDNHEQGTPEFYMNNSGSYASMDIAAAIRRAKESKT